MTGWVVSKYICLKNNIHFSCYDCGIFCRKHISVLLIYVERQPFSFTRVRRLTDLELSEWKRKYDEIVLDADDVVVSGVRFLDVERSDPDSDCYIRFFLFSLIIFLH